MSEVCPWFIIGGPDINSRKWDKVGRCLNDLLKEKGAKAVPIQSFNYWMLIRGILKSSSIEKGKIVSLAEDFIKPLSRQGSLSSLHSTANLEGVAERTSPCPSVIIDILASGSPKTRETLYPPLPGPSEGKINPGRTFPVLQKHSSSPDKLTPSEESARYYNPDWPPPVSSTEN